MNLKQWIRTNNRFITKIRNKRSIKACLRMSLNSPTHPSLRSGTNRSRGRSKSLERKGKRQKRNRVQSKINQLRQYHWRIFSRI